MINFTIIYFSLSIRNIKMDTETEMDRVQC